MHIIASSKANALTLNLDINKQPVYTLHFTDIEDI